MLQFNVVSHWLSTYKKIIPVERIPNSSNFNELWHNYVNYFRILCSKRKMQDNQNIFIILFDNYGLNSSQDNSVNSLRPRKNGRLFADDTFKRIFLKGNIRISTKNSLKFVPKGLVNKIPTLVLIMAWRRPGDKPLSEPMMVSLPTHICITRPQWVNWYFTIFTQVKLNISINVSNFEMSNIICMIMVKFAIFIKLGLVLQNNFNHTGLI